MAKNAVKWGDARWVCRAALPELQFAAQTVIGCVLGEPQILLWKRLNLMTWTSPENKQINQIYWIFWSLACLSLCCVGSDSSLCCACCPAQVICWDRAIGLQPLFMQGLTKLLGKCGFEKQFSVFVLWGGWQHAALEAIKIVVCLLFKCAFLRKTLLRKPHHQG